MVEGVPPAWLPSAPLHKLWGPDMLSPRNKAKGLVAGEGKRIGD